MVVWGTGYNTLLTSTRYSGGLGLNIGNASFAVGVGGSASTANVKTTLADVNGDQLPDLLIEDSGAIKYYLNLGTKFDTVLKTFHSGNKIEEDWSIAANAFGSVTFGFSFTIIFITIKLVISPSIGGNVSYSEKQLTIQDLDGDGLNDVIAKRKNANNNSIDASRNIIGKTHLLKKVTTPLGGSWTVDYVRSVNSYDLPQSKWLLNKITTDDNFTQDNDFKPDATLTAVSYAFPKYDRREREFFGYGQVQVKQMDPANPSGTAFRTTVTEYHNENYYLSGLQKSRTVRDQGWQILSEETTLFNLLNPEAPVINMMASANNNYLQSNLYSQSEALLDKSRLFTAVAKITSTSFEGSEGMSLVKDFTQYDNNGNVLTYIDRGESANDEYKSVIEYYTSIAGVDNSKGFPKKISVYSNGSSQPLRHREASYNNKGKLSEIKTTLKLNEVATVQFDYDSFGNLVKIDDLDNKNEPGNQHFTKNIAYDSTVNTYPETISNTLGEISTTKYEYMFGTPVLTTDKNGEKMRTRIDNRGRIIEVTGPNEMALEIANGGSAWTIRMEYRGTPL